ncbi:uncharacterized protein DUF3955 [Sinobacterium caligoides]|uniref:Uncharacterized protein DUF3955 n=1 Tax=Sinobacterium caligoides TaxID=933926 RepID=A0A3N2DLZ4_9GAMM|nr:DUF3955 domain-containing protein [Sinobacterium caligoides]ROS00355.1 uncharacterized protein DUF3955 [Sinobacterium caligoides]
MNDKFITGSLYIGLLLVAAGVLFISFEEIFYRHIDQNGAIRESIFLPMGTASFVTGFIIIVVFIITKIIKFKK